jgi:PPOX class probable F420-dependent enzyme
MTRFAAAVPATAALIGTLTGVAGVWALADPSGFAAFTNFPEHTHFVHDLGAFQLGAGVTLLLATIWRDALAVALAGFLVGNTAHAVNHLVDAELGGRAVQTWLIAVASVLLAFALVVRLRDLGWVVGYVNPASSAPLTAFARQKTVLLTSFRRDGTPVGSPVSIAVDGDHAYVRSFEKAGKTKRIRNNGHVVVEPSTTRGTVTGQALDFTARRVDGDEERRAARLLARKHPLLHRVLVPLMHRLGRAKTGRTVHFLLTPNP